MLTFGVQKCALHTLGFPVINYGDLKNIQVFKQ